MKESKYEIDFSELMILASICIPPVPIARAMFFSNLSDVYYEKMTQAERNRMFQYITKNESFSLKDADCAHFYARFDEKNQYRVLAKLDKQKIEIDCYLHEGKYRVNSTRHVEQKYIKKVVNIKSNKTIKK